MKKSMRGQVWFCLVCQEDVETHRIEVAKHGDYRAGRFMLLGGAAIACLGLFLHAGMIAMGAVICLLGIPIWLVGGLRRGVTAEICPCCGRAEFVPCDSPRAMKLKQAEETYQAARPRPMHIRPDLKVTPPAMFTRRRTVTS